MSDSAATGRRRVVHVVEIVGSFARQLEDALTSDTTESVILPDVYRGLSFLGKTPRARVDAVVVCLNGLEAGDMEFIPLARRERPGVPIFVYGTARVTEAVAAGARHVTTADEILIGLGREMVTPHQEPAESILPPPIQTPIPSEQDGEIEPLDADLDARLNAGTDDEMTEPAEPTVATSAPESLISHEPAAELEPEVKPEPVLPGVVEEPSEEPSDERPPVPWAPSSHRPQPRAPTAAGNQATVPPDDDDDRPLRTDEEIRALLGGVASEPTDASEAG